MRADPGIVGDEADTERNPAARIVVDESGQQRVVPADAFARDELPRKLRDLLADPSAGLDDALVQLARVCAEGGAGQALYDAAADVDDVRVWSAASRALTERGHAKLGERAATRAGDAALAGAAAAVGVAQVSVGREDDENTRFESLAVDAPLATLGEAQQEAAPARRRYIVAPFAVVSDAEGGAVTGPEERAMAQALAVHVANALGSAGKTRPQRAQLLVVVVDGRSLLVPTRGWHLPALLPILPVAESGLDDVIIAGTVRKVGTGLVVEVTALSRADGAIPASVTVGPDASPATLATALVARLGVLGAPGSAAGDVDDALLRAHAAAVPPFLAAAGVVDVDAAAAGAGAAMLTAEPLFDGTAGGRTVRRRALLTLATLAASLGYPLPSAWLPRLIKAVDESELSPEQQPKVAALLGRGCGPMSAAR